MGNKERGGTAQKIFPPSKSIGPSNPPREPADILFIRKHLLWVYEKLLQYFGPQNWWPGDNPFEVMLGAVLTQNTAWRNVEKAILNLKDLDLVTPEAIFTAPYAKVSNALKPSGYFNIKTKRVLAMCQFILENGTGGINPQILTWPQEKLRNALLGVRGIGPETADSILLYAAGKPSFVVDTYTRRLLARHSLGEGNEAYEDIRRFFMGVLQPETAFYNEYHALIVKVGHNFCSPNSPKCESCPLGTAFENKKKHLDIDR
jgi:endonuclease-3 related protein